jgi:hypothetical protein
MSENLSQLPIWLFVQEYNFKEHTIKVKFSKESDVVVTLRLNPIIESQLLKLIDSGQTPKRIQVFIQDNDITSLIGHEELGLGKKEEETLQELRDIVKGKYSIAQVKKMRDQLTLEISQSSDCTWFLDSELKKMVKEFYFGIVEKGESKDLRVYLRNNTEAFLKDFKLSFNSSDLEVVKSPVKIRPHEAGEFILRYTPKGEKKPLNAKMDFSCDEVYIAKGHEEDLNEKE